MVREPTVEDRVATQEAKAADLEAALLAAQDELSLTKQELSLTRELAVKLDDDSQRLKRSLRDARLDSGERLWDVLARDVGLSGRDLRDLIGYMAGERRKAGRR